MRAGLVYKVMAVVHGTNQSFPLLSIIFSEYPKKSTNTFKVKNITMYTNKVTK